MTEPLRLGSLPSVPSSRARATRVPWLWTCATQTSVTVDLTAVGPVRLSCEGFEEAESISREELVLVGKDGRRGRVAVDRWFALAVVAATLGSRAPKAVRPLGRVERGVLAGHVAASLAQRRCHVAVSLDEPRFASAPRTITLALRAETSAMVGRIRLDIPPEWLSPRPETPAESARLRETLGEALGRLPILISVELATTEIQVSEWAVALPGDAVLFAGHPFLTASEWPVSLRLGDYAADAIIKQDAVSFVGPFLEVASRALAASHTSITTRERIAKESRAMSVQPDDHTLTAISAAPIEIVAEVGRLNLRGEEVLGLQRGSILPLGHHGQIVNLLVGGQPWAKGELVNVDGELGVRITELAPV